jgi:hypothetical protein
MLKSSKLSSLRIGYSFWGFLGDYKIVDGREISSPDGNATYSYSIIAELVDRGHEIFRMMPDRDSEAFMIHSDNDFASFDQHTRLKAYTSMENGFDSFPQLDILLLEWRFPIPGRNFPINYPGVQPDLKQQTMMLEYYKNTNTKIVIFDLDHKLTLEDEKKWCPDAIFETSWHPKEQWIQRIHTPIPCNFDAVVDAMIGVPNKFMQLVYVGSRYERDDVIDQYIKPFSDQRPSTVYFYGNWKDYPELYKEALTRWPNICFNNRITVRDFADVYGEAVAVPLLGKRSYFESGFVVARIFESILFGSIPFGFAEHREINREVPEYLIARDYYDMMRICDNLIDLEFRQKAFQEMKGYLIAHSATFFVDVLEDQCGS